MVIKQLLPYTKDLTVTMPIQLTHSYIAQVKQSKPALFPQLELLQVSTLEELQ